MAISLQKVNTAHRAVVLAGEEIARVLPDKPVGLDLDTARVFVTFLEKRVTTEDASDEASSFDWNWSSSTGSTSSKCATLCTPGGDRKGRRAPMRGAVSLRGENHAMPNTGRRPEQQIQRALFQHLALRAVPGAVAYHPFNGGFRKPVEAAIAKALGVLPGIPDVAIVARGEPFFLELKAPGGRLSAAQVDCQERLANAGAHVATAIGIDAALDQLAAWQLLRPSR